MESSLESSGQSSINIKEGKETDPLFLAIDSLTADEPLKDILIDMFIRLDFTETALDDVVTILKRKGVVTEQDFVRKVIAKGISPDKTKINEIMSQPIVTIKPDADLSEAAELMNETGIHKIIVVDEAYKLLGVITPRLLVSNFNEYVYKITRDIVRHASFTQFF